MTNLDDMTTAQISEYLKERQWKESQQKQRLQAEAEKLFVDQTKVDIYEASDYCGLRAGNLAFYYGYEVTTNDENEEWCFTVKQDGVLEMLIPTSQLYPAKSENILWYLLSGIGQYLNAKSEA